MATPLRSFETPTRRLSLLGKFCLPASFICLFSYKLLLLRTYFHTPEQPFSVLIGGRRTYIILDPRHIAETYKKTKEMLFDAYIDQVMGYVDVSQSARDIMWNSMVDETSLSVPNSVRSWVRADMVQGPTSRRFYTDFLSELDSVLRNDSAFTTGNGHIHGMLKWTGDIIVMVSTNAFFGTSCFAHSPELLDAFHTFNHHAWKLLFRYPKILSKTAHDAKDICVQSLTKYFELPQHQRQDATPFVLRSEIEMRKNGISSRDIAAVLFKLYWAYVNSRSSSIYFDEVMYSNNGAESTAIRPFSPFGFLPMLYISPN